MSRWVLSLKIYKSKILPASLLFVLVPGILLRLIYLGSLVLYWDEPLHSIRIDALSFYDVVIFNNASALFALLVHFLLPLGKIEIMARMPSLIAGILSIWVVYHLGRRLFSERTGLWAAAFTAFSPYLIRYSQYARAYSVFLLFCLAAALFFYEALEHGKEKHWMLFALFLLLAAYTHLSGLLLIPAWGLFLLAAFFMYEGLGWEIGVGIFRSRLLSFGTWTAASLLFAVALYIPDGSVRGFLSLSMKRASSFVNPIPNIFKTAHSLFVTQLEMTSVVVIIFFILILAGTAAGLRKSLPQTTYILALILVPFFIFVLLRPRPVNLASADRYLIFTLPLFFLLAANGLSALGKGLGALLTRMEGLQVMMPRLLETASVVLILLFGFNTEHYALNFWRLGSYPFPREVRSFLEDEISRDSLVYMDDFPARDMILIANPLTRKIPMDLLEHPVRPDFQVDPKQSRLMLFRTDNDVLGFFIKKNVDLWVISDTHPGVHRAILRQSDWRMRVEVNELGDRSVYHLSGPALAGDKIIRAAQGLSARKNDDLRLRGLALLQARTALMLGNFERAVNYLSRSREVFSEQSYSISRPHHPLDRLFGWDPFHVQQFSQKCFYEEPIAGYLFLDGEEFFNRGEEKKALSAFAECRIFSHKFDRLIADRVTSLGHRSLNRGNPSGAIDLYRNALQMTEERPFVSFMLSESFRRSEDEESADNQLREAFNISAKEADEIRTRSPLILAVEDAGRWYLLFRAEQGSVIEGNITGKIGKNHIRKRLLDPRDGAVRLEGGLSLHLEFGNKRNKAVIFEGRRRLSMDFQWNGNPVNPVILHLTKK